jgi:hypothetical protein
MKEIKEKLKEYKQLENYDDLLKLYPFKNWIRYYSKSKKKLRVGGLLVKTDPELRFITLANLNNKLIWSVQLNEDNVIFIPKEVTIKDNNIDTDSTYEETSVIDEDEDIITDKEEIKNMLYKLYLKGTFNSCL